MVASFYTKSYLNNMEAIYMCLLKALYWITLVQQHIQKQYQNLNNEQVILCSNFFV